MSKLLVVCRRLGENIADFVFTLLTRRWLSVLESFSVIIVGSVIHLSFHFNFKSLFEWTCKVEFIRPISIVADSTHSNDNLFSKIFPCNTLKVFDLTYDINNQCDVVLLTGVLDATRCHAIVVVALLISSRG